MITAQQWNSARASLDALRALIRGRRVVLLGLGTSNKPTAAFLLGMSAELVGCDAKSEARFEADNPGLAGHLRADGVRLVFGEGYLSALEGAEIIFRSPGIRPDLPQIKAAVNSGAILTGEIELFAQMRPCPLYAVTGSSGKTTTTTLISMMLEASGRYENVALGGNIGTPLLPRLGALTVRDCAVAELSSFQLQTFDAGGCAATTCAPDVAVITNITPNHLNWHTDFAEYIAAKSNLIRFMPPERPVILEFDDEQTRKMGLERRKSGGTVVFFSGTAGPGEIGEPCVWLDGDEITVTESGRSTAIADRRIEKLPGVFNTEHYMAAAAAALFHPAFEPDGALIEKIGGIMRTFGGVEHRIEYFATKRGVKFYNSSIDSSPDRVGAALSCFPERVVVVAGGRDKGIPGTYGQMARLLAQHACAAVLTGESLEQLREALLADPEYDPARTALICEPDFERAALAAADAAKPEQAVILSPGFTSFDRFNNFEERGRFFKEVINKLDD